MRIITNRVTTHCNQSSLTPLHSTYYGRTDGDYPLMFVVFTKESNLNKAYVRISEKFSTMYEVSLKLQS